MLLLLMQAVHSVEDAILTQSLRAGLGELSVGFAGGAEGVDLGPRRGVRAEGLDEVDGSAGG